MGGEAAFSPLIQILRGFDNLPAIHYDESQSGSSKWNAASPGVISMLMGWWPRTLTEEVAWHPERAVTGPMGPVG